MTMPALAIVDDRREMRDTLVNCIAPDLPPEWEVIEIPPLRDVAAYAEFVTDENVAVLVVDERLNEEGGGVAYAGHELAAALRDDLPEFPIFMITAFAEDEGVKESRGLVEMVLQKNAFFDDVETWVTRFVRAGQRYLEANGARHARFSELAELSATRALSEEEHRELTELQATIAAGSLSSGVLYKADVVRSLGELLTEADELRRQIEEVLGGTAAGAPEKEDDHESGEGS